MNIYILIVILLGTISTLTVVNSLNAPTKKTILKNKIYACLFIAGVVCLIAKEGFILDILN